EPSLGDLAELDNVTLDSSPSLGDQLGIGEGDEHSELLGDISLLEEAIAELETEAEQASEPSESTATRLEDMEVSSDFDAGLAGLIDEDDVTSTPAANSEAVNVQTTAESEPAVSTKPAQTAEASVPVLDEEVELSHSVLEFNTEQEAALSEQSIPTLDEVATQFEQPDSIAFEDTASRPKSASATDAMSQFLSEGGPLEMPLDSEINLDDEIPDFSLGGDFSNSASSLYSEPASEMTKSVEHKVSMGSGSSLNLSIPYELHAQLSKKIDGLVVEAATSITNELHNQLTLRMEKLLTQAVESVLPSLMDQMAEGLRTEVKEKVRSQLPNIINDVLSTTRLTDK
ncbi:MAG: hypothetical protein OEX19_06385, partial [Gammaproteobacteria bacterium]|nr:hypothetical protein [Gammaproteobacteria bacterium]